MPASDETVLYHKAYCWQHARRIKDRQRKNILTLGHGTRQSENTAGLVHRRLSVVPLRLSVPLISWQPSANIHVSERILPYNLSGLASQQADLDRPVVLERRRARILNREAHSKRLARLHHRVVPDLLDDEPMSKSLAKHYECQVPPERVCPCKGYAGMEEAPDKDCRVFPCAQERGMENCGHCPNFGCDTLKTHMDIVEECLKKHPDISEED